MTGQTSAQMALRDPDIRLMLRVRAGDRMAEDQLVRAILGRFQNLARRMLNRYPDLRQEQVPLGHNPPTIRIAHLRRRSD